MLELVDALRRDGLTVVTTMHDLTLAGQYAERLVLLNEGSVVAEGTAVEVLVDVDAREVITAAIDTVPARMPVALRLPAGPLTAHLDPDHLRRVVINLVENAQRHAATSVQVTVDARPDLLVIDVDDDGPGIPEADRDRVFKRFTRLDESRTADSGGSGLGLPIARDLARALGGALDLRDPPEWAGCRFQVAIPRHHPEEPHPGARRPVDPDPGQAVEWDRSPLPADTGDRLPGDGCPNGTVGPEGNPQNASP